MPPKSSRLGRGKTSLDHRCTWCGKSLLTAQGLKLHVSQSENCRRAWEVWVLSKGPAASAPDQLASTSTDGLNNEDVPSFNRADSPEPLPHVPDLSEAEYTHSDRRARVEEVPDEEDIVQWVKRYPRHAAKVLGLGENTFERWRRENAEEGRSRWYPFPNEKEWELGRWAVKNLGSNQIGEFLKLAIIKDLGLSATSSYLFNQQVDQLPNKMSWIYNQVTVTGDEVDENGQVATETLDLWRRDPIECIRELIGNPAFREMMAYEPELHFSDEELLNRVIDEMWTGDWWWEIQDKLPAGATIAPVILASDKTRLSLFRGDQAAWPVYMSIGNISKTLRRQVSSRATVLVGYIPTSKLSCFTAANRSVAGYQLWHHCMEKILHPLIEAGSQGTDMVCADGYIRRIFPIVSAYVADHPEQCLLINGKQNYCPRGRVDPNNRGDPSECLLRSVADTLEALDLHRDGYNPSLFDEEGLHPVYEPFWRHLPHCNIFTCITPDILHQLHKGVFKDHLVDWCTSLVGEDELDRRFKAVPDLPGLRHFKKGISHVSQWTGREHKDMQKLLVALLAGAVEDKVLVVAQALVDFIYLAQFQTHTTETLNALRAALDTFHQNKEIFVSLGIREHFNIPKVHSMLHYYEAILQKGTLDGYNTELPERLHIEYAKDAYRAGNRRDYIAHMTTWLRRQEAVDERSAFLDWLRGAEEREQGVERSVDAEEEVDGDDDEGDRHPEEEDLRQHELTAVPPGASQARMTNFGAYKIAKTPAYPRTTALQLSTLHRAPEFLPAFQHFVQIELPSSPVLPHLVRSFRVYKQIKIQRSWTAFTDSRKTHFDRVRAIPAVSAVGRKRSVPAHFDPVLVIEDAVLYLHRPKGSLQGVRAARVKAIFDLPPEYGTRQHPLAYIEWYTPFTRRDPVTKMYQVARSTRNRKPNASIVGVERILGPCHLMAKCGQAIDHSWSSANVLDVAQAFHVNPYFTIDAFASGGLYHVF